MNKDVLNITSDDDITDIIKMLRASKSKIVAIVPPASSPVLRSSVNIKLIKKTANSLSKIPVLITTDASLLKLAREYSFHVSDSLQSKPYIPTADTEPEAPVTTSEQVAAEFTAPADHIPDYTSADSETSDDDTTETEEPIDDATLADASAETTDATSEQTLDTPTGFVAWLKAHKIPVIISASALVLVVAFLIWATLFAPAVSIKVAIHTSSSNFSENVTFTRDSKEEDSAAGIFYLSEEKYEDKSEVEFKATGKRNDGKKATGELTVSKYFKSDEYSKTIPANTQFSYNGIVYIATEGSTIQWDDDSNCENGSNARDILKNGCKISGTVSVTATEPGEDYNIAESNTGWESISDGYDDIVDIYNSTAIDGGTTEMVTIIAQSDIDGAIKKLKDSISDTEAKTKLTSGLSDTNFIVESSFKRSDPEIKSDVNAGDKAEKGKITKKTTFYIYTIDSVRLEEFIHKKATLADDQKIYAIANPFIERFQESGDKYTAKLKTTYKVGPKVTEADVQEKSLGKKIGEVQTLLKSINGVTSVDIQTSYFWVTKIPTDINKLTIDVEVE